MRTRFMHVLGGAAVLALSVGCAGSSGPEGGPQTLEEARALLDQKERQIGNLEESVQDREARVAKLERSLSEQRSLPAVSAAPRSMSAAGGLYPPNAQAGHCYAKVLAPAQFETADVTVLKRDATARLEIIPEQYETGTEQVLVREASSRIEVIPATYKFVEEQVLVKPASTKLVEVPAKYEWQEERVMVSPAQTVWKKGRGPIEKVDNATGEILCLVDEPAKYQTVRKRVLLSPATTRQVEAPAVYSTVKKKVIDRPPSTRTIEIPAEYKTVKVTKLVRPASTRTIEIPAEYATVKQTKKVSDGEMVWREILCETNANGEVVAGLQRALKSAGHDPGPIDGILGRQTLAAVKSYQQKKGLSTGGLTVATLDSLNVKR